MTAHGLAATLAVLLALLLDRLFAEPPSRYHPVVWFGKLVERVDREWSSPKLAGVLVALSLPLLGAAVAYVLVGLAAAVAPLLAAVLAGLVLFSATSLRMLTDAARTVVDRSESDLDAAREALPALVGRDLTDLSPELVRSAAVESAAENLSDGLVAPLLAFAVFAGVSLSAAAAAAAYVKCVNTLDSMLGYPGAFGWASARLDDLVMFVPARVTAVIVAFAAGDPDAPLRARRYAGKPPSPNAGWPMGALAAGLNVRLEKPGVYVLNDVANLPDADRAREGIAAVDRAGVAAYGLVALWGVLLWL